MGDSRSKQLKWLGIVMILTLSEFVYAQEFINTRKISLSRGDTIVVAGILADVKIDDVNPKVFYHWYANGHIYMNQGGYSGNLLHGAYVEYNSAGSLLLKGAYERGLKSGQWIYWYVDGAIKETIEFEGGLLEGKTTRYTPDGRILFSAKYRNNRLHGEMLTVLSDTLYTVSYRKGTEKKRTPLHVFTE